MRDPKGKPKEQKAVEDSYPPEEAARRAAASLKRLLTTPPKPKIGCQEAAVADLKRRLKVGE